MEKFELIYKAGWHNEENDGFHSFRWMSHQASLSLHLPPEPGQKMLLLIAGHSFAPEKPRLKVFVEDKKVGERAIDPAFSSYLFPLEREGEFSVTFVLDRVFQAPEDSRELGIMFRSIEVIYLDRLQAPLYGEGWYEWEEGELFPYRWMRREARIILPPSWKKGYLIMPISCEYFNQKQTLSLFLASQELANWPLLYQWNAYSLELPDPHYQSSLELRLKLSCLFPEQYHPEDRRELGLRIGPLLWHQDEERHRDIVFYHQNAIKNYQEMMAGQTVLSSFPTNLGIDLYSRCNVFPPCVYCLFDRMKILEGEDKEVVIDDRTLASYGPFFAAARTVVNCSFGEPLLHPRFEEILEFCASRGKIVELSTNGQAFTARTIRALLGKPIYLYVSLDAATAATYAKIRNERFEEILANLIKLNEERKKSKRLPKIFMVFMPMRVNLHELEEYFRLCQKIEADALVLRPLLYLEKPNIKEERGGYLFDYEKELLTPEEIRAVVRRAEELSRKYKVPVANQFEFGYIPHPEHKGTHTNF